MNWKEEAKREFRGYKALKESILKDKACRARAATEKTDADLIEEVKWRWS